MGSSAQLEYSVAGVTSEEDTTAYLEVALRVARGAGELIKTAFLLPRGQYDRKSATDPVTETDRATEAYILRQIRSAFPKHRFIGEESAPDEEWTDEPTWIVDPLDGTANFVIVGVVYNPILDELYYATHSGPALLNGAPLAVSSVRELQSACLAVEFGSDRAPAKVELLLANTAAVLRNSAQCLRAFGSCALDMCYLAAGRLDVYCEQGPYAWDMAAGALIVERAGGVVRDAVGGPLSLTGRSLLASNQFLLDQIREVYTPPVSHTTAL